MKRVAFAVLLLLALVFPAQAKTIYVKTTGDDANPGLSWDSAKKTCTSAVDSAASGDEIWVASGTYAEHFILKSGVKLYGGFPADGGSWESRDPAANVTFMDAPSRGAIITLANPSDAKTLVDGFKFRNIYGGIGTGDETLWASAIYSYHSNAVISNNVFTECDQDAIVVIYNNPTIKNNRFIGCDGTVTVYHAGPLVTDNTFINNTWGVFCMQIFFGDYGAIRIFNNTFTGCGWPAISFYAPGDGIISGNTIYNCGIGNSAGFPVAAIDVSEGTVVTISGNIITDNPREAIHVSSTRGRIQNNVIARNGSGIILAKTTIQALNNTIVKNQGCGVSIEGGYPIIYNNAVTQNSGGIRNNVAYTGSPTIYSNYIYGNNADLYGWASDYEGFTLDPSNKIEDPLLKDIAANDYHLTVNSPCINKGANIPANSLTRDVEGNPRFSGVVIDVGAFEYQLPLVSPGAAKSLDPTTLMESSDAVVSAVFSDFFYIEKEDRSSGILVKSPGHNLGVGKKVRTGGTVKKNEDGELFIDAGPNVAVIPGSTASIAPLALNNSAIGGGRFGLQNGVWSWKETLEPEAGLNNIGLLVKVFGKITQVDAAGTYFYIDDGSGLIDGTKTDGVDNVGIRVAFSGTINPQWGYLLVTGISSCFRESDGTLRRQIKVASPTDIIVPWGATIKGVITKPSHIPVNLALESDHPVPYSYYNFWTINGPTDAVRMRVHFQKVESDTSEDMSLYIADAAYNLIHTFTSVYPGVSDLWSSWMDGNSVNIEMSCYNGGYYGFRIDGYEYALAEGAPMPGVTVTLEPGHITAVTGEDGSFSFDNLLAGSYTATPSLSGCVFTPASQSVTLTNGQTADGMDFAQE